MTIEEILVLLPCHSLEDFPTHLHAADSANLLACCTALWHPALIHHARKLPTWARADILPVDLSGRLLAVPATSEDWLPVDFAARTEAESSVVLRGDGDRAAMAQQALQQCGIASNFADETIANFFALGFCRLHVELLTRIARYTTTIDDIRLLSDVLAAVDAALAGEREDEQQALIRCFEQLCESRRYFFPVDPHLIDLTLVAESTLGDSLRGEMQSPLPGNLLISGETLDAMAEREPTSVAAIRAAIERDELGLVGGEYAEREFPLLPAEIWRQDLLRGIETSQRILGKRPTVYGRRRAGLSPLLPQLLCRTGFQGVLHFTLDDGQFPTAQSAKVRWGNMDSGVIEAIAQVPVDAAQPTPFLELPRRLGEALDRDQVATFVFAHWPAATSIWYEDLRRGSQFSSVLGKFVTLDDYFANTQTASDTASFEPDDYRLPYLQQDVAAGCDRPISRFVEQQRHHLQAFSDRVCASLQSEINGTGLFSTGAASAHEAARCANEPPRSEAPTERLLLNPLLAPVVRGGEKPIHIPGMGFARVVGDATATGKLGTAPAMMEGTTLRNEFCEIVVDPITGSIRSMHTANTRSNRLSQQIALRTAGPRQKAGARWHDPDLDAIYSVMAADSVEARQPSPTTATVTSRGRIINREGKPLALFEQRTSLTLGSPFVEIEIDLTPDQLPEADPWNSYYAARFAFPDVALTWHRGLGVGSATTHRARIEAPVYVEATAPRWRTAILTGGIPWHRLVNGRTLDTLLIVRGETCRTFRLGVTFDHPNPTLAALERGPTCEARDVPQAMAAVLPAAGWFFHVNARSVVATGWEPHADGRGFTARLLETAGTGGQICLQSWKPVGTARHTDFLGTTLCELTLAHDKIWLDIKPYDWMQIEVCFAE